MALSHATCRLFWQWQVHTDHAVGGAVFSHHDADARSRSALLQPCWPLALWNCWTGVIPCNFRRHADAICILAKAQPKVVKQLVAGADKDLISTLLECAANILNGNMILQPSQKARACPESPPTADGEPAGQHCGPDSPEGPPLVGGVGSLVKGLRHHRHK